MGKLYKIKFSFDSFITGAARILDMGATFKPHTVLPDNIDPDFLVLSQDWCMVGDDLRHAIKSEESKRAA